MKRICIFCGSNNGLNPAYIEAAITVGVILDDNGIEMVYGGGRAGLMVV